MVCLFCKQNSTTEQVCPICSRQLISYANQLKTSYQLMEEGKLTSSQLRELIEHLIYVIQQIINDIQEAFYDSSSANFLMLASMKKGFDEYLPQFQRLLVEMHSFLENKMLWEEKLREMESCEQKIRNLKKTMLELERKIRQGEITI